MCGPNLRSFGQVLREIWPVEFCLFTRRLTAHCLLSYRVICPFGMHALRVAECPCIETMVILDYEA